MTELYKQPINSIIYYFRSSLRPTENAPLQSPLQYKKFSFLRYLRSIDEIMTKTQILHNSTANRTVISQGLLNAHTGTNQRIRIRIITFTLQKLKHVLTKGIFFFLIKLRKLFLLRTYPRSTVVHRSILCR